MQFEQMYRRWKRRELRQKDAAEILNVSERTFRCYVVRYEEEGSEGLLDKRLDRVSPRRASVEEVEPREEGSGFVPLLDVDLDEILCLKHRRVVGNDNCVSYKGMRLQIPPVEDRHHFVRAKVEVREYGDGSMAIYHGRRSVGSYDREGNLVEGTERGKKVASG